MKGHDEKDLISMIQSMAPPSHSAIRLMELAADPDHELKDISAIVEADAGLTTQVLKVVNSAAFAIRGPIETVRRAIQFLGEKMIVGIAIGACAPNIFSKPLAGYESQAGQLWAHSLKTAIAARELAGLAIEKTNADVAFTAGIVHDIGKSVMTEFLAGHSREMVSKLDQGQVADYLEAEENKAGTNHSSVGAALARKWGLPRPLQVAIEYHHHPAKSEEKDRSLVYVVHLADLIAMMSGTDTGADSLGYRLDEGYTGYVRLERQDMDALMINVLSEFERTRVSLFGEAAEG